jgi:hypothetical protein
MSNNRQNGTAGSASPRTISRRGRPKEAPQPVSREAKLVATAILEVLAGVRTPDSAALATGLSVARYYFWEQRALEGLVMACEPCGDGRCSSPRHRIAALEKEVARLQQQCDRQHALTRAAQRTLSMPQLTASKAPAKTNGKGSAKTPRKRRPAVRALKAIATLKAAADVDGNSSGAVGTEVLQRSASSPSSPSAAGGAGGPVAPSATAGNQRTEE